MSVKDFESSENIDREKKEKMNEDWESHHTTTDRFPDEAKGIAETEVKNAHAAGDGSFGRADSIPENDEQKTNDSNY